MTNIFEWIDIQNIPSDMHYNIAYPRSLELQADGAISVFVSTADKITSFSQLEKGWDYGSGGPVATPIVQAAQTWNRLLNFFGFETDASPGGEGEIAIGGSCGPFYLEVIVESDETTSVAYDVGGRQEFYRLNRSTIEALSSVLDAAGETWSAYTSYTQGNITPLSVSGTGMLSRITRDRSPYSVANAWLPMGVQTANISNYTGQNLNTYVANPQSFGDSILTGYRPPPALALADLRKSATSSSKG